MLLLKPQAGRGRQASRSTRRWSGRWCRCWPTWSGPASPSIPICCASCPTISPSDMAALETEIHKLAGGELQHRLAQAAGRNPVRQDSSCRAASKTKTGAWSTDVDVLEDVAAQGHDDRQEGAGLAAAAKLRGTYTDALPSYINPQDRPRAHLLCDGVDLDRAAGLHRSQFAEHSRSAPRKAGASARPSSRAKGIKLISADYSQIELRLLAHIADIPAAEKGLCRRARHSRHDGVGNLRRAGEGHAGGSAPPRQGDQFRHRLRHFGLRPGQPARHPARAKPTTTSRNISSAFPASATIWKTTKAYAREHGYVETLFGRRIHIREIKSTRSRASRRRRARRDQCADPGHGGRHHPPRHGPRARRAGARRSSRPRCCCRCMTN